MPKVKNHKILIRGHCDTVQFIPPYELAIAKRKWKKPRDKGSKPHNGTCIEEIEFSQSDGDSLRVREVASIDKEYTYLVKKYNLADVEFLYPSIADFTRAVEKAILTFDASKPDKSDIVKNGKSIGITDEQAKRLDAAGLRTIADVKAADLARLSTVLGIEANEAQTMRQAWWSDSDEPVVVED
jgi:hypothetical protein